jgi:hypothetical protein
LEKLRKFFAKRGVMLSATVIGASISANSIQAAPVGLAATITATVLKGSAVAASTLALVKGTLKFMAWIKTKTMIVIGAGTLLAGAAVLTLHEQEELNRQQEQKIRTEEQQIRDQEQQIRAQEQKENLPPDERKQLDGKLNQLQARQGELRAKQDQLRAAQDQLRDQDPDPFAHSSTQLSPFTKVRFESDKVFVAYLGKEFELVSINGLAASDILDFCRRQYGARSAEKRFAEDLVIVLSEMGHASGPDNTVKLTLSDPNTGERKNVERAAMTRANRQAVYQALHPGQQ